MKKLAIYLSIIVALFALLYFINQQAKSAESKQYQEEAQTLYSTTPDQLDIETRKQLKDPNYQNIILPDELKSKLENKENLFVYFFSPRCQYCIATTPSLNEIAAEANVELLQYNVLEFKQGHSEYGFTQTPTLMYFHEGEKADIIEGGLSGIDSDRDETVKTAFKEFFELHKNH